MNIYLSRKELYKMKNNSNIQLNKMIWDTEFIKEFPNNDESTYVYELLELKTNKTLAYIEDIGSDAVCACIYDNLIKTNFDIIHNLKETDTKQAVVESLINDFDIFTMNMIQLPDYKYDDLKFINNYCKVCNLDTSIYDIKTLNKGIDEVIRNVC